MTNTYQEFLNKDIDITELGFIHSTEEETYFCTPKDASIIGRAGVDGIHFCSIRGFGEMIFAVNPMNSFPEYVHPLAKNFNDFLRLLLACGNTSALEQAWMWTQQQFDIFLQENPTTTEQKEILTNIATKMHLSAMKQPWQYIKNLQATFDYTKIEYTDDFFELTAEPEAPQWNVFFDGNFWTQDGNDPAEKEIIVKKQFQWAGMQWLIPSIFLCSKGFIIDFCMQVNVDHIQAFMDKWKLSIENTYDQCLSCEQQMQMEIDNPLCFYFTPHVTLNGNEFQADLRCSAGYIPPLPKCMIEQTDEKWIIDHYELDPAYGWNICRYAFPWKTTPCTELKTLSLTMEQQEISIPGPHFHIKSSGDIFEFVYPKNGDVYTLNVQEYEKQNISEKGFRQENWEYPTHYYTMKYTITPEIPDDVLTIADCANGDQPIEKHNETFSPNFISSTATIGIIGSADGPTAILFNTDTQENTRTAHSSLHFVPVDDVEWLMVFHETFNGHSVMV